MFKVVINDEYMCFYDREKIIWFFFFINIVIKIIKCGYIDIKK